MPDTAQPGSTQQPTRTSPDPVVVTPDNADPYYEQPTPVWWLEIQRFQTPDARHYYGVLVAPHAAKHRVEQMVTTRAVAEDLGLEVGDETERFGHVAVLVARAIELFEEIAPPGAELFLGSRVVRLSTRDPFAEAQHLWTRSCPV